MKDHFRFLALCLLLILAVVSAQAQTQTTGNVEGTVTDPNGAVVPNVTITISGPNLIRPQTTTSDADGYYRFSQVPPGRYTVDVAAANGFNAYKNESVEVNLSKGSTANIQLSLATGNVGTVDVVATPQIDQSSNVQGANVSTEFFSNIPTARTVQGLYTIAPTVARSGLRDASGRDRDPSVAGSSGPENSYILDGVNSTDPAVGAQICRSNLCRKFRSRQAPLAPIKDCQRAAFSTSSRNPAATIFTAIFSHMACRRVS